MEGYPQEQRQEPQGQMMSMFGSNSQVTLESLDQRVKMLEEKVGTSKSGFSLWPLSKAPEPVLGPDGKPVEPKKWGFLGFGGKSRRISGVRKGRKTKLNVAKRSNRVLNNKR
jgi:hypothetical protein